jgi:hypothetical protein
MTASVKFGLLFAGGLSLGMVLPWGLERAKPARQAETAQQPPEPSLTVRCIVEDRRAGPLAQVWTGRGLPPPKEVAPATGAWPQVEVVVQPRARNHGAHDEVVLIVRVLPPGDQPGAKEADSLRDGRARTDAS